MIDILGLTGARSTGACSMPWSICFSTSPAYHCWNFLRTNSLTDLFMLRSMGWSWSVQLTGTFTTWMLLWSNRAKTSAVIWPLKTSKIARAEWSSERLSSEHLRLMQGMIFSAYSFVSISYDQWLGVLYANHLETSMKASRCLFCLGKWVERAAALQPLSHIWLQWCGACLRFPQFRLFWIILPPWSKYSWGRCKCRCGLSWV